MDYGVVIAHQDGQAVERVMKQRYPTMLAAQAGVDQWSRRHGRGTLQIDRCGFYAYADRITRPATRIYL
jgi:hypothetical protein